MRKPDRMSIAPLSAPTLKCCPFCQAGKFLLILLQVLFMYMCIKCTLSCSSKNAVNSHFHSLSCSLYHIIFLPMMHNHRTHNMHLEGWGGRCVSWEIVIMAVLSRLGWSLTAVPLINPPAHKQNKQNAKLLTLFSYLGSSNISALGGCKWCCQFRI